MRVDLLLESWRSILGASDRRHAALTQRENSYLMLPLEAFQTTLRVQASLSQDACLGLQATDPRLVLSEALVYCSIIIRVLVGDRKIVARKECCGFYAQPAGTGQREHVFNGKKNSKEISSRI